MSPADEQRLREIIRQEIAASGVAGIYQVDPGAAIEMAQQGLDDRAHLLAEIIGKLKAGVAASYRGRGPHV